MFFHSTSCFFISAFVSFFSRAFLSNAMYSGKAENGIKGKTGRPPFSTVCIADNMRSDILYSSRGN
ncbi:hypothetical protein HMPREF3220_00069 [Citrobacter koseri]|nr:hypothetical protein HMPREF3207_03967 [Citrobacter koseri]KXA04747.1 hypothetical protein HMPREF3220_00069 [Citrobacter koseri]